jgi:chromosome segregation ATPase
MTDLDLQVQRLQQQINAFERLHTDELQRFESQLAAYRQLQADELNQLRNQLQRLTSEIAAIQAHEAESAANQPPADLEPVQLGVSRRDLLTGSISSFGPKRSSAQ